jgi:transglutaminase-like putative cysteine protease
MRHDLRVSPAARFFWMNDLYGNHVALVEIPEPSLTLEISSEVHMALLNPREDEAPLEGSRCSMVAMPVMYPQMEQPVVAGYLGSNFPEEQPRVVSWLESVTEEGRTLTAMGMVHHLNRSIHREIRYRRREEPGVQTPGKTLDLTTGSCRDMATLLIEACRALGIAARFVSGYLDTRASAAGHGSTHAWTEVYLPDCGWCGFDPTLGEEVSAKHIPLGVSSHPRGVMPVSGIYSGPPGCYLGMEVSVSIKREEGALPVGGLVQNLFGGGGGR